LFLYLFPTFGHPIPEVMKLEKPKKQRLFSFNTAKAPLFSRPARMKQMRRTQRGWN